MLLLRLLEGGGREGEGMMLVLVGTSEEERKRKNLALMWIGPIHSLDFSGEPQPVGTQTRVLAFCVTIISFSFFLPFLIFSQIFHPYLIAKRYCKANI
jgi:hypothetical protein